MKINLVEHYSHESILYSTLFSDILLDPEEDLNIKSSAFIAYWADEIILDPNIKDQQLQYAWKNFLATKEEEENDDFFDYQEYLDEFLEAFPTDEWVVHKLNYRGFACGPTFHTFWIVTTRDCIHFETEEDFEAYLAKKI